MGKIKTIDSLLKEAASLVTIASDDDLSCLESAQGIFDDITKQVSQSSKASKELQKEIAGSTNVAAKLIEQLFAGECDNSADVFEQISQAVSQLQQLTEEIDKTCSGKSSGNKQKKDKSADSEPKTKPDASEAVILAEDDLPLLVDFAAEAAEHIESSEAKLLDLEADPENDETINHIFRGFHTIKGMAGFLGLTEIGKLSHSAENLLDMGRKKELKLVDANMDVIFESVDMLKSMLAGLGKAIDTDRKLAPLSNLDALLLKLEDCIAGKAEIIDISKDTVVEEIIADEQDDKKPSDAAAKPKAGSTSADEKIKVSTERLDKLINMVGELVISHSMVEQGVISSSTGADQELLKKLGHQGKIVRELQELSMLMRMVPIKGVFHKMSRLVRDLSRKSGKKVEFITSGEETELDRNVVDQIADPLIHMIRNSVDHGVESEDERKKAGKNPVGKIRLSSFHKGGNVIIEIQDDGKGLDKEKILAKAVDNGLVSQNAELSDRDIFKLIFSAGLSTAAKVTSVSGRGVGMDVVRKNIEALRGKIEIDSEVGKGTTFTISLPLTMAIIDGQIVRIGTEKYVIPIGSIVSCIRPTDKEIVTVQGKGELVRTQQQLLPMVRLYRLFNAKPDSEEPTESAVVIVEEDSKKGAVLVDELLGQQQVVIKSLGKGIGKMKGVSGGAIMGDGKISLILDIAGLMEIFNA